MQDALQLVLGVQHVESHRDWLCRRYPCRVDQLHAPFQTCARIRDNTLNAWPHRQEVVPARSRAVRTSLARHPGQTMRLHRHQDGRTMEEDFIQTQDQDEPLTELI